MVILLLPPRDRIIRQSVQILHPLPSYILEPLRIRLQPIPIRSSRRVTSRRPPQRIVAVGEVACGLLAGADVDGALIGAVEVAGAWGLVGKGEVGLALGDDGGFVFFRLVDYGLWWRS